MEKSNSTEQVRHIVIFRFKEGAELEKVAAFTQAFRALQAKIPGIVDFEHGQNISPEGLGRGLNHVYLLTFENAARRDAYLPHAEHKKFGELIASLGIHEEVFVVDYHPQQ